MASLQHSTQKLIETQTQAAKATAQAAKQLAEVSVGWCIGGFEGMDKRS